MSDRRRTSGAKPAPAGIEVRHAARCGVKRNETCDCTPSFRACVNTGRGKPKLQKTFRTLSAAVRWREDAKVDLRRGAVSPPKPLTVRDAADAWVTGAKKGSIRNRSGKAYKPSAIRGYEQALRDYIVPEFGSRRVTELQRGDVQRLVDRLVSDGLSASTVRNALLPLRAICRRALTRGDIHINPTLGLELPAQCGKRDRVASPEEAEDLIRALPPGDRALWATALYAGLRLGELQALRWEDVDLQNRLLRVRRSWDRHEGDVEPKSTAGTRTVPIPAVLRKELVTHRASSEIQSFVFGRTEQLPFSASGVVTRAHRLWKAAGLQKIGLHECRHTFASLMIAAGVNIKALQIFMGHASITMTMDLYGHLLPGSEDEAASLLDAFLNARDEDGS